MPNDDEIKIGLMDVDLLQPWLDGERPLAELREQLPFLQSDKEAQRYLDGIRRGLESAARGELYTTEEVQRELEKRRRARRAAA